MVTLDSIVDTNRPGTINPLADTTGTILNDDFAIVVSSTGTEGIIKSLDTIPPLSVQDVDPSPSTAFVSVNDTPQFDVSIVAGSCYHIYDVEVDGTSVGPIDVAEPEYNNHTSFSYTFDPVVEDHSIEASYVINTYTIETVAFGANGTVTDSFEVDCNSGSHVVTATANPDYHISWFRVGPASATLDATNDILAATGEESYSHTFSGPITENMRVEVAFSIKVTLTHESPFGSFHPVPDEFGIIDVEYGADFILDIVAEEHSVQGPNAVPERAVRNADDDGWEDDAGDPLTIGIDVDADGNYIDGIGEIIYLTDDIRHHSHHLSKISLDGSETNAYCKDGGFDFTSIDYSTSGECQYTILNIIEDHDVEALFTSFIDVSSAGAGRIMNGATPITDGTDGTPQTGSLEIPAKDPFTLGFDPVAEWYVRNVYYKETSSDPTKENGLTSIGAMISYLLAEPLDVDYGFKTIFTVNEFSLSATSTFETVVFNDAALTELVKEEEGNDTKIIEWSKSGSFYVVINDSDYSVVGIAVDNNFLDLDTIREYVATPANNPDNVTFHFAITTSGTKEILEVEFTNVKVSHHIDVRDYDNVIIADVPLDAQINPNPPALMFVLDDSGSMDWEFMISGASSGLYYSNGTYRYLWDFPFSRLYGGELQAAGKHDEWKSQWFEHNKMFYKPTVKYTPWPSFTGNLELDHDDNDATAPQLIPSQLPPVDGFSDGQAHVNMYRPRYHPWHNSSCEAALTKAEDRRDGVDVSTVDLSGCSDSETFDLDDTFLALGVVSDEQIIDQESAIRTGSWNTNGDGQSHLDVYRYNSDGNGTAVYQFTPTVDGDHTVDVNWRSYGSRSTSVPYRVECPSCTPAINQVFSFNHQQSGYSFTTLGGDGNTFAFETGEPVTVTVGPANSAGSQSIDAVRFSWQGSGLSLNAIINAHYYTWDDANGDDEYQDTEDIWLVNITDPITYTKVLDKNQDVSAANLGTVYSGATLPTDVDLQTFSNPTDPNAFVAERQNFADWFSFYRSRTLTATAAVSLSIEKMSNVRVGFRTINHSSSYGISQSALPVNVWGERDKTKYLYYLLYDFEIGSKGTPLRSGIRKVAQYFDATDNSGGDVQDTVLQSGLVNNGNDYLSPYAPDKNGDEKNGDRCKDSFAILVTDGFWNGDSGYNNQGTVTYDIPTEYSHLKDIWKYTLADTAYDYYQRQDLMDDADGDLQKMITYSVAFGLSGTKPFDKTCEFTGGNCPDWPQPTSNGQTTIDDLWHAAVNGGGEFLSADSPDSLVDALASIVLDIQGLQGSSSSLSVSGDELYFAVNDKVRMYQPSWNSSNWSGDLEAYAIDPVTGDVLSPAIWSASESLSDRVRTGSSGSPEKRIIATYNPEEVSGTPIGGVPFAIGSLSNIQKLQLFPYFAPTRTSGDVVYYLRGDTTNAGGAHCVDTACFSDFRSRLYTDSAGVVRTHLLADIVNSQGTFQDYYNADGSFKGSIVFIGANDGMLHAFSGEDADMGKELFAYVPNLVYQNLRVLADPDFTSGDHKMFVDGTPVTETITYKDASDNKVTKTILVGGVGKGGKGYYCLDISDAYKTISSDADLADRVLWEFPGVAEKFAVNATVGFASDSIIFNTALTDDQKDKIIAAKYIMLHGANIDSGFLQKSNDGMYEVDSISIDKTVVKVKGAPFSVMANVTVTITESISDHDVGYSFGKPVIVRSMDKDVGAGGWVVIVSNGYDSDSGEAVLYILDPLTGEEITNGSTKIGKIHTGMGPFNGLSSPKVIDVKNNLKADYVYAGDVIGNMWKFDLTATDEAEKWQVAFCDGGSATDHCLPGLTGMVPKPLFSGLLKQTIQGAPDIMRHQSGVGYMVIFGTGKYLGWLDLTTIDEQSLYGIWDWAPDSFDKGYLGARADNVVGGVTHIELSNWTAKDGLGAPVNTLLEQTLLVEGEITEDTDGDGSVDTTEDIDGDGVVDTYSYYRIPTFHQGDWSMGNCANKSGPGCDALTDSGIVGSSIPDGTFSVPLVNLGWAFDLPGKLENGVRIPGERMINDAIIRDGKAIMISFGFSGDKCGAAAYSFVNERDADNGGMLFEAVFDINGDRTVDNEDTVRIPNPNDPGGDSVVGVPTDKSYDGRLSNPVFGVGEDAHGDPIETKYFSGSAIDGQGGSGAKIEKLDEAAERRGVYFWRQVE